MPRRKLTSRKTLGFDKSGRYFRNLGYVRSRSGKYSQKKFYFGYDEDLAKVAVARLEALWRRVEELHAAAQQHKLTSKRHDFPPLDYEDFQSPEPTRAIWTELPLIIAESIRQSEHVVRIPLARAGVLSGLQDKAATAKNFGVPPLSSTKLGLEAAVSQKPFTIESNPYAQSLFLEQEDVDEVSELALWLDKVREWFPIIHIEVESPEISEKIESHLETKGRQLIQEGERLTSEPLTNHKLHRAIDVYKTELSKEKVDGDGETSEWAKAKGRQIQFVANNTLDLDLAQLGAPSINSILQNLAKRPYTQKGKPCSIRHAQNCMKEFRKFLEWLDECNKFNWHWPERFELKPPKVIRDVSGEPETTNPILLRKARTYTVDELKTIFEYAEPLQRLYLLFSLNFGFGNAELVSLCCDEIFLDQQHPNEDLFEFGSDESQSWIARERTKTGVLNTWKIWPETYAAIQWWQSCRLEIVNKLESQKLSQPIEMLSRNRFLITQKGKPVAVKNRRTGTIPNSWKSLNTRITDHEPNFKVLSFGKLRKTGATIIRKLANAEIASIYLAHGKPFGDDKDLEAYADRPYGQLFEALDRMHEHLKPLWDAVDAPFSRPRRLGGKSNLAPKTKAAINELLKGGMSAKDVANRLDLSTSTIYRNKEKVNE